MPTLSNRVDRASRLVRSEAEEIFKALVDGDAVARWLPPAGATGKLDAFEPWPGGAFRMTLVFGDGNMTVKRKSSENSDVADGRFVDVVPPRLLSQQFDFVSDDPDFAGTMTMTWTLAPAPGGTLVSVEAENVPAGISPEDHQTGMTSSLANLARYVEQTGA